METKELISFEKYTEIANSLSIKVGTIISAERIPKSNGLKLTVAFEDPSVQGMIYKTCFTSLGKTMGPEEFISLNCPFIMNLEPVEMKGVLSEVMIMVGESLNGKIELRNYTRGSKLM